MGASNTGFHTHCLLLFRSWAVQGPFGKLRSGNSGKINQFSKDTELVSSRTQSSSSYFMAPTGLPRTWQG